MTIRPTLNISPTFILLISCLSSGISAQSNSGSLNGNVAPAPPGDVGSSPSADITAGASGSDGSGVHLSSGATAAIVVIALVFVVAGVIMSILFFIAKKRQWTMKDTIRRSMKRAGGAIKTAVTPRLPKKMTLPPIQEHNSTRFDSQTQLHRPNFYASRHKTDIEAGFINLEESKEDEYPRTKQFGGRRERPAKLEVATLQTKPAPVNVPQTPGWAKVFGR